MRRFSSEPDLRVMLLSTGCGSVGLNLTAASYVHTVEPQWNPMVEAQAAARVDRLNQTKNIVIIRYIVERSIEERIQTRQKRKILSAEFSARQMSTGSQNTDIPNELMDLEELF
ncbi:hypothetical protein MMC31_006381 [Peltigera leucophlebia]|nr:hypothetical protein [Peltigera leucophlebia]